MNFPRQPGEAAAQNPPFPTRESQRVRAAEDPVLRALRDGWLLLCRGWERMCRSWADAKMNTPMKIFVILVGAFLVLNLAPFVVAIVAIVGGLAIPLGTLYGIYRLIWWLVVGKRASAGYPARPAGMAAGGAAASVAARPAAPQQAAKRRMYETPAAALIVKSTRQRITELIGSMLASAWSRR